MWSLLQIHYTSTRQTKYYNAFTTLMTMTTAFLFRILCVRCHPYCDDMITLTNINITHTHNNTTIYSMYFSDCRIRRQTYFKSSRHLRLRHEVKGRGRRNFTDSDFSQLCIKQVSPPVQYLLACSLIYK